MNKFFTKTSLIIFVSFLFFFIHGKIFSQCTAVIGSNISPIVGCEILTVQFTDSSTGPVLSRVWNFGDGSAASGSSVLSHSFSAGIIGDTSYIITLNIQCISGPSSIAYDTVFVHKKPKVNFAANKITACALTDSVCFTNLSTFGPGYSCLWNFGDFTSSTQFQDCHTYTTGGIYTVQLTVINTFGCANSRTFTNYINVIPAPNIDFNLSTFLGCSPLPATFTNITDTVSTSFSSWEWNFGDNTPLVNGFNPPGSHIYTSPGTYFITLSATNSLGCSNLTTKAIIVRSTPTSTFNVNSPICVNESKPIIYIGVAGANASYTWNFSGGIATPGTGSGPHNTYWTNSGTPNVTLTVLDSGCTSVTSNSVIVNPLPTVQLAVSPNDTICQNELVSFTAIPSSLVSYAFYNNSLLAQNSSIDSYSFSNSSSGDSVYVIATNSFGCSNAKGNAIIMTVKPLPVVTLASNAASICSGDSLIFTAYPSSYASYTFYQGFLQLQNSAGNIYTSYNWMDGYSIYVTAFDNGCISNSSNSITPSVFQPLPAPQVNCGTSTDTTVEFTWLPIAGATGYLVSVNGMLPFQLITGTSEFIAALTQGDSATIRVIAVGSGPCGDSDTSAIHTCYANPCSAITFNMNPYQTICLEDSLTLSLSNLNISNLNVSWNGGLAIPNNIDFTLAPTNNATVNVSVSNPLQPSCPTVNNFFVINVKPLPVVNLNVAPQADSICEGTSLIFSASPAGFNDYSFYNGTSLIQSSNNPNYNINSLTNGNSIYVVPTNNGCTGKPSDSISIIVFQPLPTPQVNCGNTTTSTIQFTWNSIAGATGYIVSVNGGAFIAPSSGNSGTTHLVSGLSPGDSSTIVVIATGSTPCGNSLPSVIHTCYAISCTAITFNYNPYQTICSGDSVALILSGFNITSPTVSWNGGSFLSNNNNVTFSPLSDTVVTISISDALHPSCGSVDNFFVINVNPLPVVTLSISQQDDTTCYGTPIVFTASPLGFTTYAFYQGYLLLQSSPSNVYSTSNWINGNSIYVVATNNGCMGNPSNSITPTITQPLTTPQVNCATTTNTTIQFTWNAITGATGYVVSINGGTFNSPSSGNTGTTHLVTGLTPGSSVNIEVIALGDLPCGNSLPSVIHTCSATNCSAITFNFNPYQTICSGDAVTLSLSGFNIANPLVSWNGAAPIANDTSITISPLTTDTVNIIVSDPLQVACTPVSNYFIIQVNPKPVATLSLSPPTATICQGLTTTFSASPAGYSNYSFFDGLTLLQNSNNPNYVSLNNTSGSFSVHVVTTNQGCSYTSSALPLTILPSPTVTLAASPSVSPVCYQDTVVFSANPTNYSNYIFYNGSSILQNSSSSSLSLSTMSIGNTNNITVVATNAGGCNSSASNNFNFIVLPPPSVSLTCSDADLIICSGNPVTFTASPGMGSYQFYNGTVLLQDSIINVFTTSGLQSGDSVYVIGTSAQGCKSFQSNSFSLTVKPSPEVFISSSDSTICAGTIITLSANQNPFNSGTTFQWVNPNSVDTFITVSPSLNTTYILNSNLNGCNGIPATLLILVDNNSPPVTNAGADATVCFGDSISLSGSGGSFLYWTPSIGLSNPNSINPHVAPTTTTTYTLHTANLYCYSADSVTISVDLCLSDITGPIPTCITPNGDGANDLFIIPDVDYFKKSSLVIYNRWGNIIFKIAPYLNDWDGKSMNGNDLTDGIYYYILDLGKKDNDNGNENKIHTGFILIQR